jgi:DNA-binding NarL/FixJ family response regulator
LEYFSGRDALERAELCLGTSSGLEEKNHHLDSDMETRIHIVGPLKLQNELMRRFLEKETGLTCMCSEEPELGALGTETDQRILVLLDCLKSDPVILWGRLGMGFKPRCFIALFNVSPDQGICKGAVNRGVRGIFFENDPPSILPKGVQVILNEELWISRDTLANCLFGIRDSARLAQKAQTALLTRREKEILMKLTTGGTNGKIADELCISPNTVKTHLYNICHKINVPNRLQAALWATKNL